MSTLISDKDSICFSMALAALRRIARKVGGLTHTTDPTNECNCPQCIAKDTLKQIERERRP